LKLTGGEASWVRCYLISDDDIMIRTPNGGKLFEKTVTIVGVGVGSLGSIVSTTLAQEGIGTIHLVD
jgi:tRNA A37 threonylcarbamoyladenosine dehydratase